MSHVTAFMHLGTLDHLSALSQWPFQHNITNRKQKIWRWIDCEKELKRELNKKAEWCLVWSQLGMWTLSDSNCLPLSVCMSANDRKITANIDFRDKLILPYRWACRYGLYEYQYWLHVRWSWLCLQLWPFLCFCICG